MKLTFSLTWFVLLVLTLPTLAQTEKSSVKLVKITQSIESEIVYSDLDRISVSFTVYYTNQPDKEKKETNYTISYKCPTPDSFLDTTSIKLDEPINFLALRTELNQKLQVKGDSVRPLQGNTVMQLFMAFSMVNQLGEKRLPAGNLILHDYIGTYKIEQKSHEVREMLVSRLTSKVMVLNIEIDSLTKKIESASKTILDNTLFIRDADYKLLNKGTIVKKNEKKLGELNEQKKQFETNTISLDTLIRILTDSLIKIDVKTKEVTTKYSKNTKLQSSSQAALSTITSEKGTLEKYSSVLSKLNSGNIFKFDSTTNTFKVGADSLKKNVLKGDSTILNDLIKKGYVKSISPAQIEATKNSFTDELSALKKMIAGKDKSIDSLAKILANEKSLVTTDEIAINNLKGTRSNTEKLQLGAINDRKNTEADLKKIENEISKTSELGKELADTLGLKRMRDERDSTNKMLEKGNRDLSTRLTSLRKLAKDENKKLISEGVFQIFKLHIQIERGYMERIQVFIPNEAGNLSIFENIHAIGFSSVKNFMHFTKTKLVSRLAPDRFIYLSDVFANYENFLENYTRDYCPGDTTINDFKPSDGFISLQREAFKNLFDTKVYTDFEGIDPNKPNGLIQFEMARRFNIKTSRIQLSHWRSDVGWLTYFNAFGSLNKIEKDKKVLELRNQDVVRDNQVVSPYYATSLDFRRYQNFTLGGELNLFLFDWPDGKLISYLDVGAAYGHTPLVQRPLNIANPTAKRDSVLLSGHSSTIYPKISVELLSEKRIGFILSFQMNHTLLYSNNNFKPITSYAKSDLTSRVTEPYARNSQVVECYIRAMPTNNKDGRFFFRARYFIQNRDRNTFFAQFQFGYSYNIRLKGFDV
jgi:hypothetical protein